jgi:hypothetical protein
MRLIKEEVSLMSRVTVSNVWGSQQGRMYTQGYARLNNMRSPIDGEDEALWGVSYYGERGWFFLRS